MAPLHTQAESKEICFLNTKQPPGGRLFCVYLCVRPGVIETPTDPWQGPVIPLNHGRILTFVALLSLTQSTD